MGFAEGVLGCCLSETRRRLVLEERPLEEEDPAAERESSLCALPQCEEMGESERARATGGVWDLLVLLLCCWDVTEERFNARRRADRTGSLGLK